MVNGGCGWRMVCEEKENLKGREEGRTRYGTGGLFLAFPSFAAAEAPWSFQWFSKQLVEPFGFRSFFHWLSLPFSKSRREIGDKDGRSILYILLLHNSEIPTIMDRRYGLTDLSLASCCLVIASSITLLCLCWFWPLARVLFTCRSWAVYAPFTCFGARYSIS